jgi:uncharacterized protein (DUF433 family)
MTEQELIERYIDLDTDRHPGGRADARLHQYGVPVWAPIGHLKAIDGDVNQVPRDYELPREVVEAALAYYRCTTEYIDARLLLNSA